MVNSNRINFHKTGSTRKGKGSFASQLFRAFLFVGLPVFVAISICFYIFLQRTADQQICEEQAVELSAVYSQMGFLFRDVENMSEEILYNTAVQEILESSAEGELYPSDTQVSYYINHIVANRDYVEGAVLAGVDHTLYSTERIFTNLSSFRNFSDKWWFRELTSRQKSYGWFPLADRTAQEETTLINGMEQSANRIVLARPIYSMKDYKSLRGYLMIYLNSDYLQGIWDSCDWGTTTNLFITDQKGNLIATNSKDGDYFSVYREIERQGLDNERGSRVVNSAEGNFVFSARPIGSEGWRIIMLTPYGEVSQTTNLYRIELLIILAAMIFVMFVLSRVITRNKALPIMELSEIMDSVNGTDSQEESREFIRESHYEERSDEIGQMYRSFSAMRKRQDDLIRDIYIKDLEKKDAELALLQTQINPHFLYNTLNSINWMALANGQDEISAMITALSDTFRLSLMKNNSPYTELEKEVQYVKSYLVLQKLRYGSRLEYELFEQEETEGLLIPRFILQPVIENALNHGIDSMEEGGKIEIRLERNENVLELSVINDNDAIDLEKMERLLAFRPEDGIYQSFEKEGYGVQNINRRIKFLCGPEYGLRYYTKDHRTYCVIQLPVMTAMPEEQTGTQEAAGEGETAE